MIAIGRKYIAETETREGTEVIGDGFSRLFRQKKVVRKKPEKKKKKKKKKKKGGRILPEPNHTVKHTVRSRNGSALSKSGFFTRNRNTRRGGGNKNTTEGKKRLGGQVFFFVSFFCFSLFLLSKIILFRFFFP